MNKYMCIYIYVYIVNWLAAPKSSIQRLPAYPSPPPDSGLAAFWICTPKWLVYVTTQGWPQPEMPKKAEHSLCSHHLWRSRRPPSTLPKRLPWAPCIRKTCLGNWFSDDPTGHVQAVIQWWKWAGFTIYIYTYIRIYIWRDIWKSTDLWFQPIQKNSMHQLGSRFLTLYCWK